MNKMEEACGMNNSLMCTRIDGTCIRISYNIYVIRQPACLVVNSLCCPLTLHAGGSGFRFCDSPNIKLTIWLVGAGPLSVS